MNRLLTTASMLALAATLASTVSARAQVDERLWGLSMVGAQKAWEKGYRGAGVVVGIMDDGIQVDHPEFAARWLGGFNVDGSPYGPYENDFHGTHVTGTVAGTNVGVAPESSIYGINWFVPTRGDQTFADGFDWAVAQGVRVINNSWGSTMIDPVTHKKRSLTVADVTREYAEAAWPEMLAALHRSVEAGVVQVFATGNSAMPQPGVESAFPYFFPDLLPTWIAVTSVGPSGDIASYAERCGVAASWCIAAPGGDGDNSLTSPDDIWSSWPGSGYASISGTSMATPHVTGAVAIAAQIFPNASGAELTQLVLQTARDVGEAGVDPIFGWGLLNVGNIVDVADPATAGTFANAAWSRFATLGHVTSVLRQRLTAPSVADYSGGGFELLGYASADRAGTRGSVTLSGAARPDLWVAPVYGTASIGSSATAFGATSTLGGLVIGADLVRNATTRFGLALGYTSTRLNTDGVPDRADADAFHLGAYGAWRDGGWFVEGTGQAAFFNQSIERRAIAGAGGISFDPVGRSRLSGTGLDLSLQAGHAFEVSGGFTVSPYLALGARWQSTGAASEDGAGIFGLALPAASYSQFEAGPGLRVESGPIRIDGASLRLAGDISYARLAGDADHATTVTLLGSSIEGRSAELGRDVFRLGAQINLATSDRHDWFALYRGAFQQRASAHTVAAGLKIRF